MKFVRHVLKISRNPAITDFYKKLGMSVLASRASEISGGTCRVFGFQELTDCQPHGARQAILELHETQDADMHSAKVRFEPPSGYWKIGILVSDLDTYRARLMTLGIAVTSPKQFLQIGYLCHLNDPDGFRIELLQRTFESTAEKSVMPSPTLGHITLRVSDAEKSIDFYQTVMGMTLLSTQSVEPNGFTLYFLANTDDRPPCSDLCDVRNREWLWQRPYTCLELQHHWGEGRTEGPYQLFDQSRHGFWGLGFESGNLSAWAKQAEHRTIAPETPSCTAHSSSESVSLRDPDGYLICVTSCD